MFCLPSWVALAAALCVFTAAAAQSIHGTVRDDAGGALPGVSVELRGAVDLTRTASTDAAGAYAFHNVPSGQYRLRTGYPARPPAWPACLARPACLY